MKTPPLHQRFLGLVLPALLLIFFAGFSASGQTHPTMDHKADGLKSTREIKPLPDSTLEELYNTSSGQWERSRVIRYTYTAGGLESQKFYDDCNDVDDFKYDYTYDTAGILIYYYRSRWDTATHQWKQDQQYENTLDIDGNVLQRIGCYWDDIDSLWQNLRMYEYSYDAYGNVMQVFFRIWDESKSQWRNYDKTDYTRDENGKATSYTWQQWNPSNSQWYNAFSMEYTYDEEGLEVNLVQCRWDTVALQWINHYKQDNTWSAEGYKLSEHEWRWDTTSGTWINYEKTEYAYDINGVNSSEVGSFWDMDDGQWIFEYRETHYYAGYSGTEMPGKDEAAIHVFPNPAFEYLIIDTDQASCCTRMELYDMQGRKVLSRQLDGNNPLVPVSHLKNGIYLYVVSGIERHSGKIEIQRQ